MIACILWGSSVEAQVKATANLDTSAMTIGDQVTLTLEVEAPVDEMLQWPTWQDTIVNKVEIVKKGILDTIEIRKDNLRKYIQEMVVTSFDSGYYAIPPIRFEYYNGDDSIRHFVETEPFLLEVHNVPVNLEEDIRDIKPVIRPGIAFREILPWLLIVIVVGLMVLGVFMFIKGKRNSVEVEMLRFDPEIPPHEFALRELEKLMVEKLWQQGKVTLYYTKLTEILRIYLQLKLDIHAMEMITPEIMTTIRQKKVPDLAMDQMAEILERADMVKFARFQPELLVHEESMKKAVNFVLLTKNHFVEKNESVEQTDQKVNTKEGTDV